MLHILFLIAAVIGGTVMVCQFAMTLIGLGHDSSDWHDGDFSGDVSNAGHLPSDVHVDGNHESSLDHSVDAGHQHPDSNWLFGVLSFRTLIAAAAFFGISGETALSAGYTRGIAFTIALLAGVAAMYGMYYLMQGLSKLTSSGNERIGSALGKQGTVYVPIPAEEKGMGKIQLTLQNRTVEYQAVSAESAPLRTGEKVEVIGVRNSDTVAVKRIAEAV